MTDHSSHKSTWRNRLNLRFRPASTSSSHESHKQSSYVDCSLSRDEPGSVSVFQKVDSKLASSTQSPDERSAWSVNTQTGERKDHTELLHSLTHTGDFDSDDEEAKVVLAVGNELPGEQRMARLPDGIWERILCYLNLVGAASLAFASKRLRSTAGEGTWRTLNESEHRLEKVEFLALMDGELPNHLLCFPCATFHVRTNPGEERLKASHIINPLFHCQYANIPGASPPRLRLTPGQSLPFPFLQLALRAQRFSSIHGIPIQSLSRRYSDPSSSTWTHRTSFLAQRSHLLLRVTSQSVASPGLPPSGLRHLLYTRTDYTPYFSVCAHWRDGVLMDVCKCALSHIPRPQEGLAAQLAKKPQISLTTLRQTSLVTLCTFCRPLRRCPECATEYLIEIKVVEDRDAAPSAPLGGSAVVRGATPGRFRQCIQVTRWSDLGDGKGSPWEGEWGACNGTASDGYDSFGKVGKRAVSGRFESHFGVTMPAQKMLSLNPSGQRKGEEGNGWY